MGPVFLCQQFVSSSMEDEWPTVSPASTLSYWLSLSNYLSSSPSYSSLYLISPHALPSAHTLSSSLPFPQTHPLLCYVIDLILISFCFMTPSLLSQQRLILCGSGMCFDQILTSNLISDFSDTSLMRCLCPYFIFTSRLMFHWLDVEFALS